MKCLSSCCSAWFAISGSCGQRSAQKHGAEGRGCCMGFIGWSRTWIGCHVEDPVHWPGECRAQRGFPCQSRFKRGKQGRQSNALGVQAPSETPPPLAEGVQGEAARYQSLASVQTANEKQTLDTAHLRRADNGAARPWGVASLNPRLCSPTPAGSGMRSGGVRSGLRRFLLRSVTARSAVPSIGRKPIRASDPARGGFETRPYRPRP